MLFLFLWPFTNVLRTPTSFDSVPSGVNVTSLTPTTMTTTTKPTSTITTSTIGSLAGEHAELLFVLWHETCYVFCIRLLTWQINIRNRSQLSWATNYIKPSRLRRGERECELGEPAECFDNPWNQFAAALQWKVQVWKHHNWTNFQLSWEPNYEEAKLAKVSNFIITGPELGADTGFGTERLHPGVASASVLICFSIRVKLICFSICMCWSASAQTSLLVLDSQYLSKSTQKKTTTATSQHPCINQRWQGGATNALWWTVFSRMQRWGCVYFRHMASMGMQRWTLFATLSPTQAEKVFLWAPCGNSFHLADPDFCDIALDFSMARSNGKISL